MLDGAFFAHALLWLIGAMAVCTSVVTIGALFSMARTGYRKD